MDIEKLINLIIKCAYNVRLQLPAGFMESVYKNALLVELNENGISEIETEKPLKVIYKGHIVGDFRADIIIEQRVILELKSVQNLIPLHEAQLVNYLTATNIDNGLLINFGGDKLEIKRKYRFYNKSCFN